MRKVGKTIEVPFMLQKFCRPGPFSKDFPKEATVVLDANLHRGLVKGGIGQHGGENSSLQSFLATLTVSCLHNGQPLAELGCGTEHVEDEMNVPPLLGDTVRGEVLLQESLVAPEAKIPSVDVVFRRKTEVAPVSNRRLDTLSEFAEVEPEVKGRVKSATRADIGFPAIKILRNGVCIECVVRQRLSVEGSGDR